MEHTGYLGNARVILNHFDAATQADIQHMAVSYESEDETMGKLHAARSRRAAAAAAALYSKQDILEQYCISERGLGALEADRRSFFSCLSSHQLSPCTRSSILTVCVRQKVPSDENLADLYRRPPPPAYATYPRKPRWGPPPPEIYTYDRDLNSSYFRRSGHTEASSYQWMPSDDESVRMERPRSILDHHHHHTTPHRTKHVSFARSHTLTSFDDAVVSLGASTSSLSTSARSHERLIDIRRSLDRIIPITKQPEFTDNVIVMEKLIRTPMKTQATQTEACLGRKPLPPGQMNLSPRTVHRVKMVSQGAQTNGIIINGRRLTKSYSEATASTTHPPPPLLPLLDDSAMFIDHEPLHRTLSDEPPRSPFILTSPPPDLLPPIPSDSSSLVNDSEESECKKEIFIDFKPQLPITTTSLSRDQQYAMLKKRKLKLTKTQSDGEILLDQQRKIFTGTSSTMSVSHENILCVDDDDEVVRVDDEDVVVMEDEKYAPYFKTTIRHEGIFKDLDDHVFSSIDEEGNGLYKQDSIDEVFHERYIYDGKYLKVENSSTSENETRKSSDDGHDDDEEEEEEEECVVPSSSFYVRDDKSLFASSDSLDLRDHSDGIWNESQATVLQADSGTDNGTALSDMAVTSPVSVKLLTPSSRRKHLLMMQHQQRSSIDTETLEEEELVDQLTIARPSSPRLVLETPSISVKGPPESSTSSSSKHFLQLRKKTISPTTYTQQQQQQQQKRRHEPLPAPPLAALPILDCIVTPSQQAVAVVPDLLLARTDSGRTNTTDLSESTTTTDDYITANSTDSSRRSTSARRATTLATTTSAATVVVTAASAAASVTTTTLTGPDGSSFESGSSIYSLTKGDYLVHDDDDMDMVVPSFSPPPPQPPPPSLMLIEESECTPVPEAAVVVRTGRSSPTGSSSSSGSYSLNGSCPDLPTQRRRQPPPPPQPQPPAVPSTTTTTTTTTTKRVPSVSDDEDGEEEEEEERSAHYSSSGYYDSPLEDDSAWKMERKDVHKKDQMTLMQMKAGTNKELLMPKQPKQRRIRTRSPMQLHRKIQQQQHQHQQMKVKSAQLSSSGPSSGELKTYEERKPLTSDDSVTTEHSPRKCKKLIRDKGRKSPRSPIGRKRSDSVDEKVRKKFPASVPAAQPSAVAPTTTRSEETVTTVISPKSPQLSPTKHDTTRLKALSAESLRSVSPGSDSVFYSDPSSHAATSDHHVHCLHCGKEVDIVTTDDLEKSSSQPDIVQPPAGFADSPRIKPTAAAAATAPGGRLFKKFEKRYRSEDRGHGERRHYRYRSDGMRAKSEERAGKENGKSKLRPMQRSREASLEGLRTTDSSPSVLPAAPDDEDDIGMYNIPYIEHSWIFIDDRDDDGGWSRPPSTEEEYYSNPESTESEHEFKKRYQAITHRMVHRKSCLEMYKRQASKSFAPESTTGEHESLRTSLEELLKLMLVVWCKENEALRIIASKQNESDKTVIVRRESGEFGFRIHGSKPVVVSAIEPDTPAETSGLEVGDIVLAVNGVSVLDKSHSEVVKIAHAGSDTLTLEVARTSGVLSPTTAEVHGGAALYNGYLWKLGGHASGTPSNKWVRRWFALKKDNCLYFYKTDMDKQPVGALMLFNYDIVRIDDDDGNAVGNEEVPRRPFRFCLRRKGVPTLHLAGDTEQSVARWMEVLLQASEDSQMSDSWLEQARRNLTLAPAQIRRPDCFGYLIKLGTQWKSWSRRYCVLKDACLYFYQDANAKNAFGVACLHGYRVQQTSSGSKKHAFEIVPNDPKQKHYYFHTESDMDRKRWLAALEYSIDRWLKVD